VNVYYNDIDPFCCAWLAQLMRHGLIPAGEIDNRSIADVRGSDLAGFDQCHFFAGIGGWAYALQIAGWPSGKRVWTGSCPCQPLSSAGQRKGHADERHLWPAFYGLVSECSPPVVFGEQVTSKDGLEWLAGIRADLEVLEYAIGAADLCGAGIGSPQIRQRIYWVADRASGGTRRTKPDYGLSESFAHWTEYVEQTGRCCSDHNRQVRRSPPGVLLVADGISANVARISRIGNALIPQVAALFVTAFCEAKHMRCAA
jgi:DNA (cytosine-5)-methyltransferase 1